LYVTEWANHTIRKITPAGAVSTIAGSAGQAGFVDGPGLTMARLNVPDGIAVDNKGNVFFTEQGNNSVRRIDALGDVLTLVGTAGAGFKDGGRTNAQMNRPGGIAAHVDGSLIVADTYNHALRRVVWQTNAAPTEAVVLIEVNPSITIFGVAGRTYRVESTESLVAPTWTVLGEVTLISPVETWFDTQPLTRARRFYRAVLKN
jgi:streptogramin lyase